MREEIIGTKQIYSGRIVRLTVHNVRLPDGTETTREQVEHRGAVAIVALDNARNVLMARQFRLAAGRVMLEIPAGTLEPGEASEACAIRELQEEVGHKPGKLEALGGIYVAPGYTTEYINLFLATDLVESKLAMDGDERIEVARIPLQEAVAMIDRGEIEDAKSIVGLLRVARRLGVR